VLPGFNLTLVFSLIVLFFKTVLLG